MVRGIDRFLKKPERGPVPWIDQVQRIDAPGIAPEQQRARMTGIREPQFARRDVRHRVKCRREKRLAGLAQNRPEAAVDFGEKLSSATSWATACARP